MLEHLACDAAVSYKFRKMHMVMHVFGYKPQRV